MSAAIPHFSLRSAAYLLISSSRLLTPLSPVREAVHRLAVLDRDWTSIWPGPPRRSSTLPGRSREPSGSVQLAVGTGLVHRCWQVLRQHAGDLIDWDAELGRQLLELLIAERRLDLIRRDRQVRRVCAQPGLDAIAKSCLLQHAEHALVAADTFKCLCDKI